MAEFTLGVEPDTMTVLLTRGADFYQVLSTDAATPYPAGIGVSIEFDTGQVWQATASPTTITFDVDETAVETVYQAQPKTARLWYVDGDLRLLWARGQVVWR